MLNGVPSPERQPPPPSPTDRTPNAQLKRMSPVDPQFEQLSAYIDGELSAPEARAVEDWLASDPQARYLYRQLSSMQAALGQIRPPARSPAEMEQMTQRVFTLADRAVGIPSFPRLFPHQLYQKVAAVVVVVLGSGLSTWQWQPPQPLISLEDPPVTISSLPPSARIAERYLLHPPASQDPYSILFTETDL